MEKISNHHENRVLSKGQVLSETMKMTEEFYGTEMDPEQIPITQDSVAKLDRLSPDWFEYELNPEGKPVSWTVIVPTQESLAEKFLKGEISERQLLDLSVTESSYGALYLCSAFTVPEERGKGLAAKTMVRSLEKMAKKDNVLYFAWPYSKEGTELIGKLEKTLGCKIAVRKAYS